MRPNILAMFNQGAFVASIKGQKTAVACIKKTDATVKQNRRTSREAWRTNY